MSDRDLGDISCKPVGINKLPICLILASGSRLPYT